MFINNFDPVAIQIFSIEIRWYSLAYIFGILIGWLYCKKILIKDKNISKLFDDLISYLIIVWEEKCAARAKKLKHNS